MNPTLNKWTWAIGILLACLIQTVGAATFENFTYTDNGEGITITGYPKNAGSATVPSEIDGKPVTTIGFQAFAYCRSLEQVNIPNGVTTIGDNAFQGCTLLHTITLPPSVTTIGQYAFVECSYLPSIIIPPNVNTIGQMAFFRCGRITSATLPESVTTIGWGAFNGCGSMTKINIPSGITSIGASTFSNCSSLTTINIPSSVTSIGQSAFYECSGLTNVIVPNGLTSIGYQAFYGCSGLTRITLPNTVTNVASDVFSKCTNLNIIHFEGNKPILSKAPYGWPQPDGIFSNTPATVYYNPETSGWGTTFAGRPTSSEPPQVPIYSQEQYNAAIVTGVDAVTNNPNAYGLYTPEQIQTISIGTPLLAKDPTTGKFLLKIKAQKSQDLQNFQTLDFTTGASSINADGEIEFLFDSGDTAAFFRIQGK